MANAPRDRRKKKDTTAMPASSLSLTANARDTYGVIVTMREQATGRLETKHEVGTTLVALEQVLTSFAQREEDWCVVCISTPQTVYRDLQGTRTGDPDKVPRPEQQLLGRIGRLKMLEPVAPTAATLKPRQWTNVAPLDTHSRRV